MFCMQCGAKLPDHAKFCFQCGAKTDDAAPVEAARAAEPPVPASEPAPVSVSAPVVDFSEVEPVVRRRPVADEAKNDAEKAESMILENIFSSLDPAVCHSEYYFLNSGNPMLAGYGMAVNNGYVLRHVSRFPNDDYILSTEDGKDKRRLDIKVKLHKAEYKYLMGFNTQGVWFMVRSQINERFLNVRFLCADVLNGRVIEYPIEHQHGTIRDVYIYGDELCYINESHSDEKQFLYRITPNGGCTQLFDTQKDESVFRLSANASRIAWGFISKRDVKVFGRWFFFDRATKQTSHIAIRPDSDRAWLPLVDVYAVDLAKNTMYTSLSQNEAKRYELPEQCIATRKIDDPADFHILTYKTDRQPAIWKITRDWKDYYFDGTVYYAIPSNAQLDRYDRFGNRFVLGGTGNGACQNFLVTDKWLYVNYDAFDMVRLPKLFSAKKGTAKENPEAFFVFGHDRDFRM